LPAYSRIFSVHPEGTTRLQDVFSLKVRHWLSVQRLEDRVEALQMRHQRGVLLPKRRIAVDQHRFIPSIAG
ncbi:MAG: hypothetical protein R6V58_11340, partial [Planctomycetota bacterium]